MGLEPEYQEQILAVVPKFSGALGLPASMLLIREVILSHLKSKKNGGGGGGGGNTIIRTLALVAFFLSLDAFGWFMSTWFVPENSGWAFAAGTIRTCEFQGFLLQVVIGAPLSTCAMSWYFFLLVAKGKTADDLIKYEKIVTPLIISYSFGSAFYLLAIGQFNQIGAVCWVIGSPPGCENSSYHPSDIPCDRGNWAWLYGMFMFYGLIWISIVLILGFNICIYWNLEDKHEAQWFATQSFFYAAAFVVTWAPSTTWSGMHWTASGGSFAVDLLSGLLEPLGGFWNLMIFLRDRPASRARIMRVLCCECLGKEDSNANAIDSDGPPPALPPVPVGTDKESALRGSSTKQAASLAGEDDPEAL